ncbi:amidohydrolase [Promethearchaeum syntrophicum]|uniref:Amidohydrolase n=1 Tax=Promethearchaeum syntrophicum TaxID=2594042 RepID=A0A5B9DAP0_9ARCH
MTIYFNAKIFTLDGIKSWMRVENGKIIELGSGEVEKTEDSIDMEQKTILPGLMDAHLHVFSLGLHDKSLKLEGCRSIFEIQSKLKEFAINREGWIIGRGWDQDLFEGKKYIRKEDLDQIIPNQPVRLSRVCGHIVVVNSFALKILGINQHTEDPDGGEIERDIDGHPTGILKEKAVDLVSPLIIVERNKRKEMISIGLQQCLEVGLTGVQTNDEEAWTIYKELQKEGRVPIRVYLTPNHNEIGRTDTPKPGTRDGLLYCDRVKLMVDGSLGAHTAAMREPYADTGETGILVYSQEELNKLVGEAKAAGYRVEIHAIGDLAAETVINAIEVNNDNNRPILTHAQVLGEDLLEKMKNLKIIANIQPIFIITDGKWADTLLGKESERRKYSYAWKTMIDKGIHVSGGSDAPVETNNPLLGMYSAIFREVWNGTIWREEERLTFEEVLFIYTKGAAYSAKEEERLGELALGFEADFVVLKEDVINHPELLNDAKVQQVYVSGIQKLARP